MIDTSGRACKLFYFSFDRITLMPNSIVHEGCANARASRALDKIEKKKHVDGNVCQGHDWTFPHTLASNNMFPLEVICIYICIYAKIDDFDRTVLL